MGVEHGSLIFFLLSLLQKYELWFDRLTTNGSIKIPFTLSRELAERSKGVFGVLQEALLYQWLEKYENAAFHPVCIFFYQEESWRPMSMIWG